MLNCRPLNWFHVKKILVQKWIYNFHTFLGAGKININCRACKRWWICSWNLQALAWKPILLMMWLPVVHALHLLPGTLLNVFLACRYHQGYFMVFIFLRDLTLHLIAWNTSLKLVITKFQVSHPLITINKMYWQQLMLIPMCFSDHLKCCLCTSIIKSSSFFFLFCLQIQNLVTDTDEWSPWLPGHSLTGIIPFASWQIEEGKKSLASALKNSSVLFSVYAVASNTIVRPSLFLALCHKTFFDTSINLSSQPRKWEANFTFQLSNHFGGLKGDEKAMSRWPMKGQQNSKWDSVAISGWCSSARCYSGSGTRSDHPFQATEIESSMTKKISVHS